MVNFPVFQPANIKNALTTLDNFVPTQSDAANWLGAPVDATAWMLRKAGVPVGNQPAFGSGQIQNWLAAMSNPSQFRQNLLNRLPPYQAYLQLTGQPGAYQQTSAPQQDSGNLFPIYQPPQTTPGQLGLSLQMAKRLQSSR